MPADYVACRDSYVKKGVSMKTAKARCAAWFYKKHGYTVNEAHKKGEAMAESPLPPELVGEDLSEIDWDLVELMLKDLLEIDKLAEAISTKSIKPIKDATEAQSKIIAINTEFLEDFNVVEIVATKVGAKAYTEDGRAVIWTQKALDKAQGTWKLGKASMNHEDVNHGRILASFMDNDLLRMVVKVSDGLKEWIKRAGDIIGVSIEAMNVKINKAFEIISAVGTGVTFVFPPHEPACTIDDGCGIVGTEILAFIPPEAGTLPDEGKKILSKVYSECRAKQKGSEDPKDKEYCAKIAWTAVKKAGFSKDKEDKEGEWTNSIESILSSASTIDDDWMILPYIKTEWKTWGSTNTNVINTINAPINIGEKDKILETPTKGEHMTEETKEEPKTICAEKHERLMKEKDDAMAALNIEIVSLKATVTKFEDEKRSRLLETLKSEGVDTESYKTETIPVIEKVILAVQTFKKKEENKPEINSGAVVTATETKTEPAGNIMTATVDKALEEATIAAEAEKKKLDEIKEKAKRFGY